MSRRPISVHPFPARMAPELALGVLADLHPGSCVVDPMCGSGTVLRYASDLGHEAIGADVDPLAVLMARVWTTPVDADELLGHAAELVSEAGRLDAERLRLPWVDNDAATASFVNYWFAQKQASDLRRLAWCLQAGRGSVHDVLRLALSRVIVTKDRGASLGRDISHSRPHRVTTMNDYDVFGGFKLAVRAILDALTRTPPAGRVRVLRQDGRILGGVGAGCVDCVLTSPPYLNAIDYIRGHRLALVWLGYRVGDLRSIRGGSVGAERRLDTGGDEALRILVRQQLPCLSELSPRYQGIFDRYVHDLLRLSRQIRRILRPGGVAVLVVGDSTLRGTFVRNSAAVDLVMEEMGFSKVNELRREIPPSRRYLPPPIAREKSNLGNRMRTEVVLTYLNPPAKSTSTENVFPEAAARRSKVAVLGDKRPETGPG